MCLIRALRDCKQRSLTVSKKAPTVNKKASPLLKCSSPCLSRTSCREVGLVKRLVAQRVIFCFQGKGS